MRTTRRLWGALAASLAATAMGPASIARAAAPDVTIDGPRSGSVIDNPTPTFSGGSNERIDDVTLKIYSGASVAGLAVRTLTTTVPPLKGRWSLGPVEALADGTYTAQARQTNVLGEIGRSEPVVFTVDLGSPGSTPAGSTPAHSPPAASFTWFPSAPMTGEGVSLVSTTTDSASPITALAWALTGNGAFQLGGPLERTSFSTPGAHVVRLRATAADGLSSLATETIQVERLPPTLMEPFPIVRVVGTDTATGVKLRLLTVQAPAGALITVDCKGRGCPVRSERRLARSSGARVPPVAFRRFDGFLRAGLRIDIRVFKPGEIGKYTRFVIRRRRLPRRVDECLDPAAGIKPMACPPS
jgi:Bacterial Ig-like domain